LLLAQSGSVRLSRLAVIGQAVRQMQHWIKNLYNFSGRTIAPEWRVLTWVSDGPPGRQPQYAIGDEFLIYDVPSRSFPARARVTGETEHRPELVNREGGPGEGKRWPYVTPVDVIAAVDTAVAPTPFMIDIAITQGGHRRIVEDVYDRAVSHLPAGFRRARLTAPLSRPIAIERETAEPFEQRFEIATRTAYRREQALVHRLAKHLRKKGHRVSRHAITLPDGTELRSDLFDHDILLLVEAKAKADRSSIRMAVGQLLDYERFVFPKPKLRAILLPERPADDLLALLAWMCHEGRAPARGRGAVLSA